MGRSSTPGAKLRPRRPPSAPHRPPDALPSWGMPRASKSHSQGEYTMDNHVTIYIYVYIICILYRYIYLYLRMFLNPSWTTHIFWWFVQHPPIYGRNGWIHFLPKQKQKFSIKSPNVSATFLSQAASFETSPAPLRCRASLNRWHLQSHRAPRGCKGAPGLENVNDS